MAIYVYKAKKGPAEIINGQIDADSQDDAIDKLSAMGLLAIRVEERQKKDDGGRQAQGSKANLEYIRIKTQDIDIFTRQLASLLRSGVPILNALLLISRQAETGALSKLAGSLEKRVSEGGTFSGAIAEYPRNFNNLYINMVLAGEKSGALGEALSSLAEYRKKEREIRQKIAAALAYPLLMIVVGIATIFIMLTLFLPKFTGFFENAHQALPLCTRILIGISGFMAAYWYWFLIILVLALAVFGRVERGTKKKFFIDLVKLHAPFIKGFIKYAEVAKFARTLSLLIKNGIPVCDGLELAAGVLDSDVFREYLKESRIKIIKQGCTLSDSLKNTDVFPAFAVNMISVGEEGGKLEGALRDISEIYEGEVEQAMKIAAALLEPALILIIGGMVGFIVFAMLLPIFSIGTVVR